MKVSMLPVEKKQQDFIDLFGGYNHNIRIQDNEFYDMENLSSDDYPTLSPRKPRGIPANVVKGVDLNGILYKSNLYSVNVTDGCLMLYTNNRGQMLKSTSIPSDVERQLVMMGSYIVILPDKQFFNTADDTYGYIERSFTSSVDTTITALPCDIEGNVYSIDAVSNTTPEDAWDGFVWLDTNKEPAVLKQFTVSNSTWMPLSSTYVRITCTGIGEQFKDGDGVEISGFTNKEVEGLNGHTIIQKKVDKDNIVVTGVLNTINHDYVLKFAENYVSKKAPFVHSTVPIEENEFLGCNFIVQGKKVECISNTAVEEATGFEIDTEDVEKWFCKKRATLSLAYDAVDETRVWVRINQGDNFIENNLQMFVAINSRDNIVATSGCGYDDGDNSLVYIDFMRPITARAGSLIYPVAFVKYEGLYQTEITFNDYVTPKIGEGLCRLPEDIFTQTAPITVTRTMPVLDYVIESNNRLWGCRYGKDDKGNFVNQIYASALGDFKNWSVFAGTSADSYFATVGTSGEFTGAVNYMGYPVFFKDDCIHTIYGAYPAQYQINTTMARGVQKGSSKSLTVVNEVLYYKSRDGVMAYTGALPSCISNQLGDAQYYDAVTSGYKNKLYVSMCTDISDYYNLFVYDTNRGVWYKESGINAKQMVTTDKDVVYLDDEFNVKSLFGSGTKDDAPVEWFAETGNLGIDKANKKYVSKINIKMCVSPSARASIYIKYPKGNWRHIKDVSSAGYSIKSIRIPIIPYRCDYFKLLIKGSGHANIYSISKTIEEGSDM